MVIMPPHQQYRYIVQECGENPEEEKLPLRLSKMNDVEKNVETSSCRLYYVKFFKYCFIYHQRKKKIFHDSF